MAKKIIQETLDAGIKPIVLTLDPVKSFTPDDREIIRTYLTINSLDVGVIHPKQYRFVARRTNQGNQLVERNIDKLFYEMPEILKEHKNVRCFTVPVYARMMRGGIISKAFFDAFVKFPDVDPNMIYVELSSDILYEELDPVKEELQALRDMGIRLAISEVGDAFCPVLRLSELEFDIAFLDPYTVASIGTDDEVKVAGNVVRFLKYLNATVIAADMKDEAQAPYAEKLGCDGYTLMSYEPPVLSADDGGNTVVGEVNV